VVVAEAEEPPAQKTQALVVALGEAAVLHPMAKEAPGEEAVAQHQPKLAQASLILSRARPLR
jgi:hypothetical protein